MCRGAEIRVAIADLPGPARTAVAQLVSAAPGLATVALSASLDELRDDIATARPDVVLLDDRLLRGGAVTDLELGVRFAMTGVDDDPAYAARARSLGADAWVEKDCADLLLAALWDAQSPMSLCSSA